MGAQAEIPRLSAEQIPETDDDEKKGLDADADFRDESNEIDDEKEQVVDGGDSSNESKKIDKPAETDQQSVQQPEYLHGWKLYSVLIAVSLVFFLMLLDIAIVVTAIPSITSHFNSLPDVGWYGAAYQLANAALQPLTGKVYTYFNAKWTFLGFFAFFEFGSLICAVAQSSKMLIVGRALAGMGGSGLQNGGLTMLAILLPLHKRPAAMGAMMGFGQIGIALGPLIGGALTQYATWRWCFFINLPCGALVALLMGFQKVPQGPLRPRVNNSVRETILKKFDLIGFVLFAPAAIQFFLALEWGGNLYTWNSATIIGLFCGAGGTFILFLAWEYREGDIAMIPLSMLKQRIVWCGCLVMAFLMTVVLLGSYYLPIYFQTVKQATPTLSGVYMLPSVLAQLFFAIFSGVMVSKLGYYLPWSLFSGVLAAIGNGLISTLGPNSPTGKWIGYQILLGAGRGAGMQMPIIAVQNTLKPDQISTAMAVMMFASTFGGALFLSLGDTVLTNSLRTEIPVYAPGVNAGAVIAAGATGTRGVVSAAQLPGVLMAYAKSIDRVFYLPVGAAAGCFIFSWGLGWKDIRKKKDLIRATAPAEEV